MTNDRERAIITCERKREYMGHKFALLDIDAIGFHTRLCEDCEWRTKYCGLSDEIRIRLEQYENLRNHFNDLVKEALGENYYNEGMDVYSCDEFTCRDLKSRLKKKRWWSR